MTADGRFFQITQQQPHQPSLPIAPDGSVPAQDRFGFMWVMNPESEPSAVTITTPFCTVPAGSRTKSVPSGSRTKTIPIRTC